MEIDAQPGRYVPIRLKLERVPGEKPAPWYERPEGCRSGGCSARRRRLAGGFEPRTEPEPPARLRQRPRPAAPAASQVTGAALDLRVTPANAAIYIDGKFVGTGEELGRLERGLAVAPGKHRIEVVAPGRDLEEPRRRCPGRSAPAGGCGSRRGGWTNLAKELMLSIAVRLEGGGGQATTLANQPNKEPITLDLSNLACLQRPT